MRAVCTSVFDTAAICPCVPFSHRLDALDFTNEDESRLCKGVRYLIFEKKTTAGFLDDDAAGGRLDCGQTEN